MGNRAVIAFEGKKVGIYLHWNGGLESVLAFMKAAETLGVRSPEEDFQYFASRFCQIVGNYFGNETSFGIDILEELDCDNGDNGLYWFKDWKLVRREFTKEKAKTLRKKDDKEKYQSILDECVEFNRPLFDKQKNIFKYSGYKVVGIESEVEV